MLLESDCGRRPRSCAWSVHLAYSDGWKVSGLQSVKMTVQGLASECRASGLGSRVLKGVGSMVESALALHYLDFWGVG